MVELQSILQLWDKARGRGQECTLATVVKTQGSSYRLPGARLLLTPDGERAGSISGGCLEDDLVKRAQWLTENGPVIRRYDTTPDGEITTEYGLGCNGIIYILLERITPENCRILDVLRQVRLTRHAVSVTHVLSPPSHVGTLFEDAGATIEAVEHEVFREELRPPVQLLLCGAGEDAIPLNHLAQYLGWQVYVYDGRAHYGRAERFPGAALVAVRQTGMALAYPSDPWTVGVIMTHSYAQDLCFLTELASLDLPYLGILGPQKRTIQLLQDAALSTEASGVTLHAPMGLDIGADGPEQVALAVVAEIQASLNGRDGGQLRDRLGSIHSGLGAGARDEAGDITAFVPTLTCV